MLGELECRLRELNAELTEALDQRDEFELANEDTLNEFLFRRKLAEFDAKIESLKAEIISAEKEYRAALRSESRDLTR